MGRLDELDRGDKVICSIVGVVVVLLTIGGYSSMIIAEKIARPQLEVQSVSVFGFNFSLYDRTLAADWNIGVSMRNPSKLFKIRYTSTMFSIDYKNRSLSTGTMKGFSQNHRSEKIVVLTSDSTVDKEVFPFENRALGLQMAEDLKGGFIDLELRLKFINKAVLGCKFENPAYAVTCPGLRVVFPTAAVAPRNGTMIGVSRLCHLYGINDYTA